MDYLNFYTITGIGFLFLFAAALYYIVWVMQYQNAATPFPATGAACPDGWMLDDAKWCVIPGVNPSSGTAAATTNVGTIHTDDATYTKLMTSVPGIHKAIITSPPTVPPNYTAANITPADFRNGLVSIDFTKADICSRKKWAVLYGITWDGVSNYTAC